MNPTRKFLGEPFTIVNTGDTVHAYVEQRYVEQQGHLAPNTGNRGVLLGATLNGADDPKNCFGLGADEARALCVWLIDNGYGAP